MALTESKKEQNYLSILADGKLHMTVPEGTEGAVVREYETSDGTKGHKWEKVYKDVIGKITKIGFFDGDYGRSLQLTITDGEEIPVVLSLSTSSNYGEDMMKKLLNIDLEKIVKIAPYSFTDEKGKSKKGVTVWQFSEETGKNEKITNYFYDTEAKKNIHGYPEPKKLKKPLSKDQWKLYFGECREFLVETITEKFGIEDQTSASDKDFEDLVESASSKLD